MINHFLKNRIVSGLAIGALISAFLSIGVFSGTFTQLHNNFSNSLYTYEEPSEEIVIVAIDDKSTSNPPSGFGLFSKWTRERYSQAVKEIRKGEPSLIAIDLIFDTSTNVVSKSKLQSLSNAAAEAQTNKAKLDLLENFVEENRSSLFDPVDAEFARTLQSSDRLILDAALNYSTGKLIKPLPQFALTATLGLVDVALDESGTLRKIQPEFYIEPEEKTYDHFALAAAKMHSGKDLKPKTQNFQMLANFFGEPFSYKMVSFVDVAKGEVSPDVFKDKIVLIGTTDFSSVHDEVYTPRSNKVPMPGVEFLANQIQTILEGKYLTNQTKLQTALATTVVAVLLSIAFTYLGITLSTVLAVAAVGGHIALAHLMYRRGLILNMVYPFLAIFLSYIAAFAYRYFVADKKKREIKSAFGHYVSEKLVEQISKNPDMVKLGGEKRTVTVFFSDVKGSTTLSEQTEISSWVSQMNEYFTVMEKILKKYDGTIDKYEGDAMMGFWNAPVEQPNHQELAYSTALEMKASLHKLHQKWQQEGKPLIEIRIGINTGESIVGNFGSEGRFDYTVMGDTVNVASRLESSANKAYGLSLIVAGAQTQNFLFREVDTVLLPGKKEPIKLLELISSITTASADQQNLVKTYQAGLAAYRQKDFASAIASFSKLPNDPASKVMLERCRLIQAGQIVPGLNENMVFQIFNK